MAHSARCGIHLRRCELGAGFVAEVVEAADRAGLARKVARLEPLIVIKG